MRNRDVLMLALYLIAIAMGVVMMVDGHGFAIVQIVVCAAAFACRMKYVLTRQ